MDLLEQIGGRRQEIEHGIRYLHLKFNAAPNAIETLTDKFRIERIRLAARFFDAEQGGQSECYFWMGAD